MSGRDLYRSVLLGGVVGGGHCDSPRVSDSLVEGELSPVSSITYSLHGASLSTHTPRKRLSLHSNLSDTPQSTQDDTQSSNYLQESFSSDSSCSFTMEVVSPRHKPSSNKENFVSPYYSPSHGVVALAPTRPRSSPLKDVQNTVNRSLFSPHKKKNLQMVSPSKRILKSPQKPSPPEDFDTNSQDSGYSESGKKVEDCFSVPISCAPRKLNLDLSPPMSRITALASKSAVCVSPGPKPPIPSVVTSTPIVASSQNEGSRPFRKFSSLSKNDEDDAMLRDLMDEENSQDAQPEHFSSLLSAPIQSMSVALTSHSESQVYATGQGRPSIRRCLSMVTTPTSSRVVCASPSPGGSSTFKRPDPPSGGSSGTEAKRRKLEEPCERLSPLSSPSATATAQLTCNPRTKRQVSTPESTTTTSQIPKPKLQRSHSESHVSIMKALNKSNGDGDLIGDFSKTWVLPTLECGKHPDLKSISVDTLAEVLVGKYSKEVASCRIIDCRYPYEFEGGHIRGAEMWHHPEIIGETLKAQKGHPTISSEDSHRNILIFHCEFSAERGPKAQRLLRELDRTANKEHYPALHFPEMYLLEGGYKAFYEKHPSLCTPKDYVRMLDSNHTEDLKHFRGKSKSWAAENKQSKSRNTLPRPGLKRFGL